MSKRFGRTQKRKMREKVAHLEYEVTVLNKQVEENAYYRVRLNELISEIRRYWKYSVLLDPEIVAIQDALPPLYQVAKLNDVGTNARYDASLLNTINQTELYYQTLYAVRIAARERIDTNALHLYVETNKGDVGYYISDEAFYVFNGMPETMKRHIADTIIQQLDKHIKESIHANKK